MTATACPAIAGGKRCLTRIWVRGVLVNHMCLAIRPGANKGKTTMATQTLKIEKTGSGSVTPFPDLNFCNFLDYAVEDPDGGRPARHRIGDVRVDAVGDTRERIIWLDLPDVFQRVGIVVSEK